MALGVGILLIAAGAVLAFAVHTTANTAGVDLHTVGLILLAVGAFGIFLSLVFLSPWSGSSPVGRRGGPPYIDDPRA